MHRDAPLLCKASCAVACSVTLTERVVDCSLLSDELTLRDPMQPRFGARVPARAMPHDDPEVNADVGHDFPFCWLLRSPSGAPDASAALSSPPPPGCCHTLVCYHDRFLILFGGGSVNSFVCNVFVYNLETHQWLRTLPENSDAMTPRLCHTAVLHGDTMIVYGGQDLHSPVVYDDVWALDITTWRWTLLQHAPEPPEGPGARRLHCAQVVGDYMYVLLGAPGVLGAAPVWRMHVPSLEWQHLSPTNYSSPGSESDTPTHVPALRGCSSAVCGDRIYLYGGFWTVDREDVDDSPPWLHFESALYEYNTLLNTFCEVFVRDFISPAPRYASALAAHSNFVYLFGGDASQRDGNVYFHRVWRLQVRGSTHTHWQPLRIRGSPAPTARSGCAYTCARASLFVFGGELATVEDGSHVSGLCVHANADDLFQLPLGYAPQLTLRESAARWIGAATAPPRAVPTVPMPAGARHTLEANRTSGGLAGSLLDAALRRRSQPLPPPPPYSPDSPDAEDQTASTERQH